MTVYLDKIRKRWRYDFWLNGVRHHDLCKDKDSQQFCVTRKAAEAAETHARAAALLRRKSRATSYTFAQAMAAYASQVEGGRTWLKQSRQISELLDYFGSDTPILKITEERIWDYITWSRKQPIQRYAGGPTAKNDLSDHRTASAFKALDRCRSDATINRYLAVLRKALKIASRTPDPSTGQSVLPFPPVVPSLKESQRLPNPVPADAIGRIVRHMPVLAGYAVALTALTGMRKTELLTRKINHYRPDLHALHIPGDETKGRRDEFIPLSPAAETIVKKLVAIAKAAKSPWLFFREVDDGKGGTKIERLSDFRKSFASAMKREGLEHHRIHDLKATFVTAVAGFDPSMAQQMARHKSPQTTQRYVAVMDSRKHLAAAGAANLINLSEVASVPRKTPTRKGPQKRPRASNA